MEPAFCVLPFTVLISTCRSLLACRRRLPVRPATAPFLGFCLAACRSACLDFLGLVLCLRYLDTATVHCSAVSAVATVSFRFPAAVLIHRLPHPQICAACLLLRMLHTFCSAPPHRAAYLHCLPAVTATGVTPVSPANFHLLLRYRSATAVLPGFRHRFQFCLPRFLRTCLLPVPARFPLPSCVFVLRSAFCFCSLPFYLPLPGSFLPFCRSVLLPAFTTPLLPVLFCHCLPVPATWVTVSCVTCLPVPVHCNLSAVGSPQCSAAFLPPPLPFSAAAFRVSPPAVLPPHCYHRSPLPYRSTCQPAVLFTACGRFVTPAVDSPFCVLPFVTACRSATITDTVTYRYTVTACLPAGSLPFFSIAGFLHCRLPATCCWFRSAAARFSGYVLLDAPAAACLPAPLCLPFCQFCCLPPGSAGSGSGLVLPACRLLPRLLLFLTLTTGSLPGLPFWMVSVSLYGFVAVFVRSRSGFWFYHTWFCTVLPAVLPDSFCLPPVLPPPRFTCVPPAMHLPAVHWLRYRRCLPPTLDTVLPATLLHYLLRSAVLPGFLRQHLPACLLPLPHGSVSTVVSRSRHLPAPAPTCISPAILPFWVLPFLRQLPFVPILLYRSFRTAVLLLTFLPLLDSTGLPCSFSRLPCLPCHRAAFIPWFRTVLRIAACRSWFLTDAVSAWTCVLPANRFVTACHRMPFCLRFWVSFAAAWILRSLFSMVRLTGCYRHFSFLPPFAPAGLLPPAVTPAGCYWVLVSAAAPSVYGRFRCRFCLGSGYMVLLPQFSAAFTACWITCCCAPQF